MPLKTPEDTEPKFHVRAYTYDVTLGKIVYLTKEDVSNMRLPFDHGWQGWAVFQDDIPVPIYRWSYYKVVDLVCRSLNNPIL